MSFWELKQRLARRLAGLENRARNWRRKAPATQKHHVVGCPLCGAAMSAFREVDGYQYFECDACDFICIDPRVLERVDAGEVLRVYGPDYWSSEIAAAHERAVGPCLIRFAELTLYATLSIDRFIDIGTGTGEFLDVLSRQLPGSSERFFGVELFPPPEEFRSRHPNYIIGTLADAPGKFQAGMCVEVIEHLTPAMVAGLAAQLAEKSEPGSIFLFNTGLTSFVRHEDPGYLDPIGRGHITVWSVPAAKRVFEPHGFVVSRLPGKTWAFIVEMPDGEATDIELQHRIWKPVPNNVEMLRDPSTSDVMFYAGRDAARAYV